MKSRYILAFDPSGNFKEGKGITGWCLLDTETKKVAKFGYISAAMYPHQQAYWDAHITLIDSFMSVCRYCFQVGWLFRNMTTKVANILERAKKAIFFSGGKSVLLVFIHVRVSYRCVALVPLKKGTARAQN